jgi:putative beta-lysine N-acetyltransferase
MARDICETIGHSVIQHGPYSNRVYLMKLDRRDLPGIVQQLDDLAHRQRYTKLFAKIPADTAADFIAHDYRQEALIPGFYRGKKDALFLGKYLDPERARTNRRETLANVLGIAHDKAEPEDTETIPPEDLKLIRCGPEQTEEMSRLYREVFPSYPFPIHDPAYLRSTMASHVDYFGIIEHGRLTALSSAEMDHSASNVEMTDFATHPSHRGQGLARCLLQAMDTAMTERGLHTAYTIARAMSPGMNISFAQLGYHYSGTLIKNTQISGAIESMNVWYKALR